MRGISRISKRDSRDADLLRCSRIGCVLVMKKYKKWRDGHENKTRNWY